MPEKKKIRLQIALLPFVLFEPPMSDKDNGFCLSERHFWTSEHFLRVGGRASRIYPLPKAQISPETRLKRFAY